MTAEDASSPEGIRGIVRFQPTPSHYLRIDYDVRFATPPKANDAFQLEDGTYAALRSVGLKNKAWSVDRVFHQLHVEEEKGEQRTTLVAVLVPDPPLSGKSLSKFASGVVAERKRTKKA